MLIPPFDLLECSWPRPVAQDGWWWASEPEWDAPPMPAPPSPHWEIVHNELCWMIDWRAHFKGGINPYDPHLGGEMRGFHVVFRLRVNQTGRLVFWDDDGSVIRRNGELLHVDCSAHELTRHDLDVREGDVLEVAQWQLGWGWLWGARLEGAPGRQTATPAELLARYREPMARRLQAPDGPPLKMYTNAATPIRTVLAIYSLVLNGYVPSGLHLFGEDQWSPRARCIIEQALPSAEVVPTAHVIERLRTCGGDAVVTMARQHWFVMKTCVGLLCPPDDACLMDDDVIILSRLDDALASFKDNDLVFAPDQDLGGGYAATWGVGAMRGHPWPLPTARFNAGLYWVRRLHDPRWLAAHMPAARPDPRVPFLWEQGFIALAYARHRVVELPSQRYLFPVFDGLPGGILGYDYAGNPCGFASIHFGGLINKPTDGAALELLAPVLDRASSTGSGAEDAATHVEVAVAESGG